MTAKEKAQELVERFKPYVDYIECSSLNERETMIKNAKQCALICIDEMIEVANAVGESDDWPAMEYFEIKKEIENL